jgi:hypothetical protein
MELWQDCVRARAAHAHKPQASQTVQQVFQLTFNRGCRE